MHGGTGAVDQQFTKIGVVSLANTTEPLFATCRTLFRDQTDPGNYDERCELSLRRGWTTCMPRTALETKSFQYSKRRRGSTTAVGQDAIARCHAEHSA
jgi:hypothetical protein